MIIWNVNLWCSLFICSPVLFHKIYVLYVVCHWQMCARHFLRFRYHLGTINIACCVNLKSFIYHLGSTVESSVSNRKQTFLLDIEQIKHFCLWMVNGWQWPYSWAYTIHKWLIGKLQKSYKREILLFLL